MNPNASPQQMMGRMILGSWITQGIYTAAELGLADELAQGPKDIAELSQRTGARPDALRRLLRALASVGVFTEVEENRFALTPLAEQLTSDSPGSHRWMAILSGAELYRTFGELLSTVRTGRPGFETAFGAPFFRYTTENPERGRIFDRAMHAAHGPETVPVLEAYDFSRFRRVVDVGGGNGTQLAEILKRHPELEGTLFDLPEVAENARATLHGAGLAHRSSVVGGDFFASVPRGGDLYVLRHVIHDWEDEAAVAILRNCRACTENGGTLILVETVLPEGDTPCFGKWLDLMMLLVGGRERTESEYRRLLGEAGYSRVRILPTAHEVSVIEALP